MKTYLKNICLVGACTILFACALEDNRQGTVNKSQTEDLNVPLGFQFNNQQTISTDITVKTHNGEPYSNIPVRFYQKKLTISEDAINTNKTINLEVVSEDKLIGVYITNSEGNVNSTLTVPAYLDKIEVVASAIGIPNQFSVPIENNALTYVFD